MLIYVRIKALSLRAKLLDITLMFTGNLMNYILIMVHSFQESKIYIYKKIIKFFLYNYLIRKYDNLKTILKEGFKVKNSNY